ncbi:hypothetical protein R6Q57_010424 [Mikania cordata]
MRINLVIRARMMLDHHEYAPSSNGSNGLWCEINFDAAISSLRDSMDSKRATMAANYVRGATFTSQVVPGLGCHLISQKWYQLIEETMKGKLDITNKLINLIQEGLFSGYKAF